MRTLALDPKIAHAFDTRGRAYLAKGEYDRTLTDFNSAVSLDPTQLAYLDGRGETYEGKGDRDRAIESYNRRSRLPHPTQTQKIIKRKRPDALLRSRQRQRPQRHLC